jgi:hypothetical protein
VTPPAKVPSSSAENKRAAEAGWRRGIAPPPDTGDSEPKAEAVDFLRIHSAHQAS